MMFTTIIDFLKPYKTVVVGISLLLVTAFSVSLIKDKLHKNALETRDKQIQQLSLDLASLKGQKQLEEQRTAEATANYEKEKQKTAAIQRRVDALLVNGVAPLPVVVTHTNLADCNKELQELKVRCTENESILVAEIKQDRETIAAADGVIKAQKEELTTANKIIEKDTKLVTELGAKCTLLEDEVKTETERKKTWRTASVTEALIIVGLVLAL